LLFSLIVEFRPTFIPASEQTTSSTTGSQQATAEVTPVPTTSALDAALSDQSAKDLAYAAASDDRAALAELEGQAAKTVPVAEYGLGVYYLTKAQELDPLPHCAPSMHWFEKNDPNTARWMKQLAKSLPADKVQTAKVCDQAMSWFEKAALASDPAATAFLGQAYYSAAVIQVAMMKSYVSANGGSSGEADRELYGDQILKKECNEALHWLRQAADTHEPNAEDVLASAYAVGPACVTADKQKALYWYKKAYADSKASAAASIADLCWDDGEASLARSWIEKAELGGANDEAAAWAIAIYYKAADANDQKAEYWHERAQELAAAEEAKYPALKLIHQKQREGFAPHTP